MPASVFRSAIVSLSLDELVSEKELLSVQMDGLLLARDFQTYDELTRRFDGVCDLLRLRGHFKRKRSKFAEALERHQRKWDQKESCLWTRDLVQRVFELWLGGWSNASALALADSLERRYSSTVFYLLMFDFMDGGRSPIWNTQEQAREIFARGNAELLKELNLHHAEMLCDYTARLAYAAKAP